MNRTSVDQQTKTANLLPPVRGILQRKCACGSKPVASGECTECAKKKKGLQRKLAIGASNDPLEQEADWVADQVMAMSTNSSIGRTPPRIQRFTGQSTGQADTVPASVDQVLARSGRPLQSALRQNMEQRFGHDFSQARLHTGSVAEQSARDVSAHAYTAGHNIVFGAGQFSPGTNEGMRLIAHELTHVVQQGGANSMSLQRSVTQIGSVNVTINYGNVISVAPGDQADRIISLVAGFTGVTPDAAQETTIRGLSSIAKRWMMFALDLLIDNFAAASTLNKAAAIQRLLSHAPNGINPPLPDLNNRFVREVFSVSGWSEIAVTSSLSTPNVADTTAIQNVVNPPPSSGSAIDPLDEPRLTARLPPALTHLLNQIDPAGISNVGTRSLSAFQSIGDVVKEEARSFFSPYADGAVGNLFDLRPEWHASANIFDVGTIVPDRDTRLSYLQNRAQIVGRNTRNNSLFIDPNIFADVNFDATRAADRVALFRIVSALEADAVIQAIVDRLIQHTGRQSGSGAGTRIGLVTEFDADSRTACEDHWRGIDTVSHEVLHALVHPNFQATSTRVSFPQVIREGFTEVLGVQLFNDKIIPNAASSPSFKTNLEAGVSGAPCPVPVAATIGYGSAGSGAESIRARVGNDNFRAAYFLGRPELAGLPI